MNQSMLACISPEDVLGAERDPTDKVSRGVWQVNDAQLPSIV
jgi:hypothetical protein